MLFGVGDFNCDDKLDERDLDVLERLLDSEGSSSECIKKADTNGDSRIDTKDWIWLWNKLRVNPSLASEKSPATQTLVAYNPKAAGAQEIAEFYLVKRNIPESHLCPISVRPGVYGTEQDLKAANKQILPCLCRVDAEVRGETSTSCDEDQREQIANRVPVRFLAIIRGLPTRLISMTGWNADVVENPSFDYYFAHSVYNPWQKVLDSKGSFWNRTLLPIDQIQASDRMVAYGRVEAMDVERTKRLISKTIEVEAIGLKGTVVSTDTRTKIREDLQAYGGNCDSHLDPTVAAAWDGCPLAVPASGVIPAGENVPKVVAAALYLGGAPTPNHHSAFNGSLSRMLGWRRTFDACTPLCRDFPTSAEQDRCRALSEDYFRELNTQCVGFAPGALGQQVRSYPVGYYGFYPSGWVNDAGPLYAVPPVLMSKPASGHFVRFGGQSAAQGQLCPSPEGGPDYPCDEHLSFKMMSKAFAIPNVDATQDLPVRISLKYRNSGNRMMVVLWATVKPAAGAETLAGSVVILEPAPDWITVSREVNFTAAQLSALSGTASISGGIRGDITANIMGVLDIDSFQLVSVSSGGSLLPADVSEFDAPAIGNFAGGGDYAANMIDRMGAVAWWGSSSHFYTGGWAFSSHGPIFDNLIAGRTLGEALFSAGNQMSGIAYGDPLYAPFAKRPRLHIEARVFEQGKEVLDLNPFEFLSDGYRRRYAVYIVGSQKDETKYAWTARVCRKISTACSESDWGVYRQGKDSFRQPLFLVGFAELFAENAAAEGTASLRLEVEDEFGIHSRSFAIQNWGKYNKAWGKVEFDRNGDGCFAGEDLSEMISEATALHPQVPVLQAVVKVYPELDLDGDGWLQPADIAPFLSPTQCTYYRRPK